MEAQDSPPPAVRVHYRGESGRWRLIGVADSISAALKLANCAGDWWLDTNDATTTLHATNKPAA